MLTHEQVKTHWWRVALVVAAVAVAAFSPGVVAGLFGVLPILAWCGLARSPRTGVIVGLFLLALLAWFVLPGSMNLAGPWVPAKIEVYWLHTTLAAVVCAIGARRGFGLLATLVLAGFVATGFSWFAGLEAPPGDEGVSPGPAQLRTTEDISCGSGGCWRVMEATGDRAHEVLHEHLSAKNFTPGPTSTITGAPRLCRSTGIVVNHRVCVDLRDLSANTVRAEWYVD